MALQQNTARSSSRILLDTSPAEEERFKAAFRVRRRLQLLLLVPVLGVLLAALLEATGPTALTLALGIRTWQVHAAAIAIPLAAFLFSAWNWRCPACRRWLRWEVRPRFCRRCGCPFD